MTIAIAYGVDICIEGNITINCIQEKRSGIKSNSLNTAAYHPSVDPCMLCAPSVTSSITVHHQPFNKIEIEWFFI